MTTLSRLLPRHSTALLAVMFVLLPVLVHAGPGPRLDSVASSAVGGGRGLRAILQFSDDAARQRVAAMLAARRRSMRSLPDTTALAVDLDAATLAQVAADTTVAQVSVDAPVRATHLAERIGRDTAPAASPRSAQRRRAEFAVAIIDSGLQPHADLPASRIRAFVDLVNGASAPYDDSGTAPTLPGSSPVTGPTAGSRPTWTWWR